MDDETAQRETLGLVGLTVLWFVFAAATLGLDGDPEWTVYLIASWFGLAGVLNFAYLARPDSWFLYRSTMTVSTGACWAQALLVPWWHVDGPDWFAETLRAGPLWLAFGLLNLAFWRRLIRWHTRYCNRRRQLAEGLVDGGT